MPAARGACPGLSQPMQTGDGLLARLMPSAPVALDDFDALCDASQTHGNGIVEVTQRGSLQIRGLSPASAAAFAGTASTLAVDAEQRPPILTSPLMGLDAHAHLDLRSLAAGLRKDLANEPALATLGPKVSVLIDGGGTLHLDEVPGDLRLQADAARLHVGIAGTGASATALSWVEPHHALEVIVHVLGGIASRGSGARARNLANRVDARALRTSLAGILSDGPRPAPRPRAEPIGSHPLKDGRAAFGVALAFGYTEAGALKRIVHAAARGGATSIQPAPGRALLIVGLAAAATSEFAAAAAAAGFVVRPDDARRSVVACAGAPACASALLSTRQLAPAIAQAAGPLLDGSLTIHVSGCSKGCAHPGATALTLAGPDRLVVQGRAGDTPHGRTSVTEFIAGLAQLHLERQRAPGVKECSAEMVSRLGRIRVLAVMGAEAQHD